MKIKHVFLTSSMIMAIATFPAISEDYYNSDIANSCQVSFLGGTGADNSTAPNSFQAQYTANQYELRKGMYLEAGDALVYGAGGTKCPANSFCIGGTYTFSETNDQGIESCPTDYSLSSPGTPDIGFCYRSCTTSDVAHSASVSGGYYYGDNNRCFATSCETGYHVQNNGPLVGKENIYVTDRAKDVAYISLLGNANSNATEFGLTENGSWAVRFEYGIVYGTSAVSLTLRYENPNISAGSGITAEGADEYIMTRKYPGNLELEYHQGHDTAPCWCKITGYTPTNGTFQNLSESSFWIYYGIPGGGDSMDICVSKCAWMIANNTDFSVAARKQLFSTGVSCEANEINVNWYDGETLYETNQCTYDGAITLPDAPEKTGYTFKGWKLVTGSSN